MITNEPVENKDGYISEDKDISIYIEDDEGNILEILIAHVIKKE